MVRLVASVRDRSTVPRPRHLVTASVLRARPARSIRGMPQIPRLPGEDPPPAPGAKHDRPAVDLMAIPLTQALVGAAVTVGIAGLRRPRRPHFRRRTMLAAIGRSTEPRLPLTAAPATGSSRTRPCCSRPCSYARLNVARVRFPPPPVPSGLRAGWFKCEPTGQTPAEAGSAEFEFRRDRGARGVLRLRRTLALPSQSSQEGARRRA